MVTPGSDAITGAERAKQADGKAETIRGKVCQQIRRRESWQPRLQTMRGETYAVT